jgi:recombination protein RecA
MSQAMRKLTAAINKTKTLVIFTNQLRMKIGVMFGNPETTTGGNALKFYASVRMEIRSIGKLEEGTGEEKSYTGIRVKVKVVKNKVAPPFRTAEFDVMYNRGISRIGDMLDLATRFEIVKKSGAFYSYGENKIGQGRDNAKAFLALAENKKILQAIEKDVLKAAKVEAAANLGDERAPQPLDSHQETIKAAKAALAEKK